MYVGRLFFRKDTGNFLHFYEMEGGIVIPSIEQDLTSIKSLDGYNINAIEVVELNQTDYEIREKCRVAKSNIRLEDGELIFTFSQEQQEQIEEFQRQISLEERIAELEMITADLLAEKLGVE